MAMAQIGGQATYRSAKLALVLMVFIDEMRYTSWEQEQVLNHLFDGKALMQRFGDVDQKIILDDDDAETRGNCGATAAVALGAMDAGHDASAEKTALGDCSHSGSNFQRP